MDKIKIRDLRNLNNLELVSKRNSLKTELAGLNRQRKLGKVEKPHNFKIIRKTIARIETLLNENQGKTKPKDAKLET